VRLVVGLGQRHQRGPALDVLDAEQHERVADRLDPARHREERRVDEPQQVVGQADVARDDLAERVHADLGILQLGDQAQLV
jgi:hypothetical protein